MIRDWKHGYNADSGYTYGFFTETTPARLAWVATLKGYRTHLKQFRYLDLGCGQGLNLILLAALHPEAEFVGVDFLPEHIAHGRQLAEQARLQNIQFIEGDFLEFKNETNQLGEFDYVVAHGITTWVSAEIRKAVFEIAQAVLKPGAIMYNSYNTYPGWLHAAPFQNLVMQYQRRLQSEDALNSAISTFEKITKVGLDINRVLPGLGERLEGMSEQDTAYLIQEYNNDWWQPVYSNQMLELAHSHKLSFIGSGTLSEMFDASYPAALRDLINQETDPITRETIRDIGIFQSFRRDVYAKGGQKTWALQNQQEVLDQRFVANELCRLPGTGEAFNWKIGLLKVEGNRDNYIKIIQAFGTDGASIREVMTKLKLTDQQTMTRQASLLLQGGWIGLLGSGETEQSKTLNRVMSTAAMLGAPYQYLSTPSMQTAIKVSDIELILVGLAKKDDHPEALAEKLVKHMHALGKRFTENGKKVEDEGTVRAKALDLAKGYLTVRWKHYEKLGVL